MLGTLVQEESDASDTTTYPVPDTTRHDVFLSPQTSEDNWWSPGLLVGRGSPNYSRSARVGPVNALLHREYDALQRRWKHHSSQQVCVPQHTAYILSLRERHKVR